MNNKRKYFDIFDVPILQIPGGHVPVLIINGRISNYALYFTRDLQKRGYSNGTIENKLKSIGRLWDYTLSTSFPDLDNYKNFLYSFFETRIHGTIQLDGSDPTGLYWSTPKYSTAERDFYNVNEYFEFISNNFNVISTKYEKKIFPGTLEYAKHINIKKNYSLFYHSIKMTNHIKCRVNKRIDNYSQYNSKNLKYKFFPPEKIFDLINAMDTIRDKMIVLLLAFGGIRISELLHLFISDISKDKDNTAKISLANPVESKYIWDVKRNRKIIKQKGTRRRYLAEEYGLLPRNLISIKDGLHLGWKSMNEEDSSNHTSYVYWTMKEAGQMFYKLHKKYIIERSKYINHPYYFISQNKNTKGEPLRISSLRNHLRNKFRKIGVNDMSVHSLRHYYGFFSANILKLNISIAKEMMHHKSEGSTSLYYKLTIETIRKAIEEGYQNINNSEKNDMILKNLKIFLKS